MAQLSELSARALRTMIGRKEISPVEIFDACCRQIEHYDPSLNAVVARDFSRGRQAALRAEKAVMSGEALGALHGLPFGVKDLVPTAGLTTTYGSLVHKDNVPDDDEPMVARIRAAGGIVIGKTNTPEFGAGANTVNRVYGATVNPFDPRMSCAGSSGGSAVALATGMMPLATGSDLGGSLRTPASFCGVVGHRPSPGAVSYEARRHGFSPLFVEGPMARNVPDAALLMSAMVGRNDRDPLSLDLDGADFAGLVAGDVSTLRVAFSADLGCVPVEKAVREAFRAKAERMAPFFKSAEWIDPDFGEVHHTFEALRAIGFADTLADYVARHRDLAGPNVIANTELAARISLADAARAQAAQTEIIRRFQRLFDEVDVLICPAASALPFPVEQLFVGEIDGVKLDTYITWCAIAYAITLATNPATAIPCGLGPTGLPFGVQVVGRYRDDLGTLRAAAGIEAAFATDPELARPVPDLDRLLNAPSAAGLVPPILTAHAGRKAVEPID